MFYGVKQYSFEVNLKNSDHSKKVHFLKYTYCLKICLYLQWFSKLLYDLICSCCMWIFTAGIVSWDSLPFKCIWFTDKKNTIKKYFFEYIYISSDSTVCVCVCLKIWFGVPYIASIMHVKLHMKCLLEASQWSWLIRLSWFLDHLFYIPNY